MEKIKVGIVNYLNTKPLLYGIRKAGLVERIELVQDFPAQIARFLVDGTIDIGLVPVTVLQHLHEHHVLTDFCIGCNGPVASVCIFSEVPIGQVQTVLLDYQSKTSVALAKILLREYWQLSPELKETHDDFRADIKGTTAGVVIGDRALEQRKISPYIYDLGEAWQHHTGLPFVFAAWVSNKKLPADFIAAFNEANKEGLNNIDKVVADNPYQAFDLKKYYSRHISYLFDSEKRKALRLFLEKLAIKAVV